MISVYLKNLTRIAMEIGGSTLDVLEDKYAVPWMWNPTKPIIGQGVKRIKSMIGQGVKRIKSIIGQDLKIVKNDLQYVKGITTFYKHVKTCERLFCIPFDISLNHCYHNLFNAALSLIFHSVLQH